MKRDHWLNSIAVLCNFFYGKKFKAEKEQPELWMIPLVGMIPGGLCTIFSGICFYLMGSSGTGVLSAIILPLFLEILNGWKGITIPVFRLEQFLASRNWSGEESAKITKGMQSQIYLASMYLFRMGLFGLLASRGSSIWFLFALGGAYLIRGEYLTGGEYDDDAPKYGNWYLLGIGFLVIAVLSFSMHAILSVPIVLLVVWLLLMWFRNCFWKNQKTDSQEMDFYGSVTENLLLIIGLILSGGPVHG